MSVLPVTLFGDKILRKKASHLTDIDMNTVKLVKGMFDTLHEANGIGLAANQVGSDKSIFIIDVSEVEGYEKIKPVTLINPVITAKSDEKIVMEEGCLSIPDIRLDIERPGGIVIKYYDLDMKEHTLEGDKVLARVLQHEYDHLQGVLFTDLIGEGTRKKLKKELDRIKGRKNEFEYPVSESPDYTIDL